MLDFLMNPSFNNTLSLSPWWFMLMAIVKMILIAVGSLVVAALCLLATGVVYKGVSCIRKNLVILIFSYPVKLEAKKSSALLPPRSDQEYHQVNLPHLAA